MKKSDKSLMRCFKNINKSYNRGINKSRFDSKKSISPIKNYVWCHGCGRKKHLYKSEGSAKKALQYADSTFEKDKKKPIRSFYCRHCLGWHLTSQEYDPRKHEKAN